MTTEAEARLFAARLAASLHETIKERLLAGAPQLDLFGEASEFLVKRFHFEPRLASNLVRGINIRIADELGCPFSAEYRAGVNRELELALKGA